MRPILSGLSFREAERLALVLSSQDIDSNAERVGRGWVLLVGERDEDEARRVLNAYFDENRGEERPESGEVSDAPGLAAEGASLSGVWAALLLLAFHCGLDLAHAYGRAIDLGGASAEAILKGELWRAVTALTLHADGAHLASNVAGLILFGSMVGRFAGYGLGWLLILASGTLGNLLNAALHHSAHISIGASTAVFGAIGMIGGYRCVESARLGAKRMRALAPLGAALALLAFMGEDERTDVTAHLFGWLSGSLLGVGFGMLRLRPGSPWRTALAGGWLQFASLMLALAVLVLSWIMAWAGA